jgi:DNA-binding response OmpR family regulator
MENVLVVEDDAATAAFLADNLIADGFEVATASGVAEGVRAIEVRGPALVILDVMLEDGNGLVVLDRVRGADVAGGSRMDPALPVLVLSGRTGELDRLRGFARGADDYVAKPFSYPELIARVRALLRRSRGRPGRGVLSVGRLLIDPAGRSVRLGDRAIALSGKEFALLHALAAEPTRVVPKGELLRGIWGYRTLAPTRTVDAHACRLRKKLGPGYVLNVRGVGYRLLERL